SINFENNILMYQSNDNPQKVLDRIKEHLNSANPPTAIVCYNDQLAISVIEVVKSMGLSIPEDISITGFDDYEISKYITPSITTMTHAKEQMGLDAAKLLVNLMEGEKGESIVYEPEIVVRDSVGRIED
ncbi:substrate-binding domain-containing protein, partial [Tetragenococcus halophilus]|uniref:substrate-binding domain-containing protein n=1 Tax=Tetragenococcus halophilus TaxID=51669 RepID=UPI00209BB067